MNMMRNFNSGRPQTGIASRPATPASRPGSQAGVDGAVRPAAQANASTQRPMNAPSGAAARGNAAGMSTRGKTDDIFMVLRQLSELLIKENAALKRYRVEEVKALAERKDRLAILYQSHMTAIQRDPSLLKGLDTSKRTMLAQLAARLAELMRDNASMLKANIQSIDIFFQAVNDAARERQDTKAASYTRNGMINGYATSRRNLAISYNQTT